MAAIDYVIYASIYLGLIATTFYILSYLSWEKKERKSYSENDLPSVSVIIPAYNEEKSIASTLKSVLKTDYPKEKFEIIFVDDGSKDKTLEVAKSFEKQGIKVFTKNNGGKGSALNYGIKKAKGEIIFTMDADTFIKEDTIRKMVDYFADKEVMCVSPAMIIHNPRSFLQRIQSIEYLLGLFLRKTFASLNSVYVTPGAFSAYRKYFFDKYGGYDEKNMTEDLEMALRVQYNGYKIENAPNAIASTISPTNFFHLLKQRRRWYYGLIKNLWAYRKVISPKYGDLGMFVIPIGVISILFAVAVTVYLFFETAINVREELIFLSNINFDFFNMASLNLYTLERVIFLFITNPIVIFLSLFIIISLFYLFYASRKIGKTSGLWINVPLFFIFFATLFGFWWVVSIIYLIFNRKVSWK